MIPWEFGSSKKANPNEEREEKCELRSMVHYDARRIETLGLDRHATYMAASTLKSPGENQELPN